MAVMILGKQPPHSAVKAKWLLWQTATFGYYVLMQAHAKAINNN
jgi:hypothetical protein